MREVVNFKGNREGLQLVLADSVEFELVIRQLRDKLASAVNFFTQGTTVQLSAAPQSFTPDQQVELVNLLADYGLTLTEKVVEESESDKEQQVSSMPPLVVQRTLRGGQEIIHGGPVIVTGDVNPGARVIAGGDIIIHGACRGITHAGAYGNTKATITAGRLLATQIRIADIIARAPDTFDKPERVETARIQDGIIVIEPAK